MLMLQRLQRVHFFRLDSALVNEFGFILVFFGCSTLKGSDSAPGGIVSTHQLGSPGASSL